MQLLIQQMSLLKTTCSGLLVERSYDRVTLSRQHCYCMQMRAYCGGLSTDVKADRTAVLMTQLLDWAVGVRQVHAVIGLPLNSLDEQVCSPDSLSYSIVVVMMIALVIVTVAVIVKVMTPSPILYSACKGRLASGSLVTLG